MAANNNKNARSYHQAGKRYQNYQCGNLVLLRCIIIGITLVNSEGEWMWCVWRVFFFSRWTRLSLLERITKCKTIIFSQASANDKILRHEGV
jgi:hypothetical protein